MNNSRSVFVRTAFLLLVVLTVSCLILPRTSYASGPDAASTEIAEANAGFNQAVKTVLEAEQAGANVSILLDRLIEAEGLVTEARTDYQAGNPGKAFEEAHDSLSTSNVVNGQAAGLKSSALANDANAFSVDLVFSSVGAASFLVVLLLVWQWFKRARYSKRLLKMKPEVATNVEA